MSPTLLALLRYAKQEDVDGAWTSVRDQVLGPIYHPEMKLANVLRVLLEAWMEALNDTRFALPGRRPGLHALEELVLAPVVGHFSVAQWPGATLETTCTVEQFYTAIVHKMISDFRLARVDWCREEIWPERYAAEAEKTKQGEDIQPGISV